MLEEMISGAMAPGLCEDGAEPNEDRIYEGGMVLASHPEIEGGTAGEGYFLTSQYDPRSSEMHVASTKFRDGRIQPEPAGHLGSSYPAFEETAVDEHSRDCDGARKKDDAVPNPGGRLLGSVGHVLLQKLLEVLPLRSQAKGEGKTRNLFPLPTSSEFILELKPELTKDELDWSICLMLSLNSLWGEV